MLFIAAAVLGNGQNAISQVEDGAEKSIGQTLAAATRFFARAFEALAELAVEGGREEGSHVIP